jgi:thiosulfate sulfurtransferase
MSAFQQISPADAHKMMENGEIQIADIRDAMSYQAGHIRAAHRVDNQNLNDYMARTDKQKPLIVCCYHGNSSQGAAQYFASQGYSEVYSLKGGYEMWKTAFPDWCQTA